MKPTSGQKEIGWERYGVFIYFAVLLLALLVLFLPSFDNPPRSDYWSAFYVFQQVEASPAPPNWPSILTFDLWQHGTYRPLSHLILYLEHLFFSPRFIWNHILNFAAYSLAVILLYLLALRLALDRVLTAALLTVFAFLFSHFDILTWTFQIWSVLAFCALLLGFILFIDHLRSRRAIILVPVGVLFLFGMLCSEVYALWPLAVLILPFSLFRDSEGKKQAPGRYTLIMLGSRISSLPGGFHHPAFGGSHHRSSPRRHPRFDRLLHPDGIL